MKRLFFLFTLICLVLLTFSMTGCETMLDVMGAMAGVSSGTGSSSSASGGGGSSTSTAWYRVTIFYNPNVPGAPTSLSMDLEVQASSNIEAENEATRQFRNMYPTYTITSFSSRRR
jgi:hypothetical protein